MHNKLAIISLEYHEKYYQQTLDCLKKQPYDVYYADRNGVGNISKAFNDAFKKYVQGKYEYVWFITNIQFEPNVPDMLLEVFNNPNIAAVHPTFDSDHQHIRPKSNILFFNPIPFIEFTAPMIKCSVFEQFMLDEDHHYYYMDLILSKQIREMGLLMAVDYGSEVKHTYLRNNRHKEGVTRKREQLRRQRDQKERKILTQKYGANWHQVLFNYEV